MADHRDPLDSDGVRLIIDEAMRDDVDRRYRLQGSRRSQEGRCQEKVSGVTLRGARRQ